MNQEMKKIAMNEAVERMDLIGISESDIVHFSLGKLTKVVVENGTIVRDELSQDEQEMIEKIEKKYDVIVYYVIKDLGVWPDGKMFDRYTLAFVDTYEGDYDFVKNDCIKTTKTLSAYIVNVEEPRCSGVEEFRFKVLAGCMINAS